MFSRVQTTKRYLQIANQILERIRSGALVQGAQLPPERELAVQMGVSRPTVREALIALELLGVVEIRIGQGTYIIGDIQTSLEDVAQAGITSPFNLLEARVIIESNTAACCAEHWANNAHNDDQLNNVVAISQAMTKIINDESRVNEFYQLGLNSIRPWPLAVPMRFWNRSFASWSMRPGIHYGNSSTERSWKINRLGNARLMNMSTSCVLSSKAMTKRPPRQCASTYSTSWIFH